MARKASYESCNYIINCNNDIKIYVQGDLECFNNYCIANTVTVVGILKEEKSSVMVPYANIKYIDVKEIEING